MRKGFFGSVAALLTSAALASAQLPTPPAATLPLEPAKPLPTPLALPAAGDAPYASNGDASSGRAWVNAEYLLWWLKKSPVPVPLATTGPPAPDGTPFGTPPTIPGALGTPGTQVLLGNGNVGTNEHSGARFTAGGWIDSDRQWGVEGSYFYLSGSTATRSVGNSGTALLTVPFNGVGAVTGENTLILAAPGNTAFASGNAVLSISNRMQGADINGIYNLLSGDGLRVGVLGGFRWLQLRENLGFGTNSTGVDPTAGIDNTSDSFRTTNNFHGAQVGARVEFSQGGFFASVTDKMALGGTDEQVNITGQTVTNFNPATAGAVQQFPGGIFAQPTNTGGYDRTRLAFANELTVTGGYQFRSWARIFMSYNFLYLNNVVVPGNQIDRTINDTGFQARIPAPGPLVGPLQPAFAYRDSSFWAQGVSAGLELRF